MASDHLSGVTSTELPPLDPADWDAFRVLAHRMVDETLDRVHGIRDDVPWRAMPAEVRAALLDEPLPRTGRPAESVYDDFARLVWPYRNGNLHPRFWGWVMGGGTPLAAMADFLAASLDPNCGGFDQAPVLVERRVIAWLAEAMGLPAAAGGILANGGTMANVLALGAARTRAAGWDVRAEGLQGARPRLLVYASTEVHGWLKKACEFLGLGASAVRKVPVTAAFELDVAALQALVTADRAAGHRPFCVVGTAGTVNTGATDDLAALADFCAREGLWFHVDGAFGAWARVAPGHGHLVAGLERADSIALDLHKWGYLPFDVAATLVRDDAALPESYGIHGAAYLDPETRGPMAHGGLHFAERGMDLSRSFRALKAWMSFRTHGFDLLGAHVARNIAQAHRLAALVDAHPALERLAPAPLNIVCFRWTAPGLARGQLDVVNREVLVRVQELGIAVPSGTVLPRGYAIRCAITNHRSRDDDFDALVAAVARLGAEVAAG